MDPVSLAVGAVAGLVLGAGVVLLAAGGWGRLQRGKMITGRESASADFAEQLKLLLNPPTTKPDGTPIRLLALLQRESRLLDFLLEDISAYADAQIGASVRDIHKKAAKAIRDHVVLEPVMPHAEGATVTVPVGFDPSAVRLLGHVTGTAPFTGVLQHHGWKCKSVKLPKPAEGQDEFVLSPAEVELPG